MSSVMVDNKAGLDGHQANNVQLSTADTINGEYKHPLHNMWTLWYFRIEKSREWSENQRRVASFGTAEDFWALYNYIQPASKLNQGCDYSLFKTTCLDTRGRFFSELECQLSSDLARMSRYCRQWRLKPSTTSAKQFQVCFTEFTEAAKEGIQPMWEDPVNKGGGRWVLNLDKRQRLHELNDMWLETMLCLIGEAFDSETEEVCGAVMNVRMKGDKIALWTRDATNVNSNMNIGHILRTRLELHPDVVLEYQAASDARDAADGLVVWCDTVCYMDASCRNGGTDRGPVLGSDSFLGHRKIVLDLTPGIVA